MYNHRGVTSNNDAESLNNKLGGKNKLKSHPNPYLLADEIKAQLLRASDEQIIQMTKHIKKRQKRRQ